MFGASAVVWAVVMLTNKLARLQNILQDGPRSRTMPCFAQRLQLESLLFLLFGKVSKHKTNDAVQNTSQRRLACEIKELLGVCVTAAQKLSSAA